MEWATEKAKGYTNAAQETAKSYTKTAQETATNPTDTANSAYETAGETTNQAYDAAANPGDTATEAYEKTGEYTPTGATILNTPPFNTFKPDPSMVWQGHLIYVLLAAGCTLPWWAFVVAADYFQFLYPGSHIIRYITLAYYAPWVIMYILVASSWREGTSWVKINVCLAVSVVALVLITLLDGVFMGNHGTTTTFWVTLSAVAVAGCADAIGQGSLWGISAELPQSFTKAYCIGAAFSGLFVFIVRVITKASLSSSSTGLRIGAIVYFAVCALFLVLVASLFAYVHYMPEMGYYNSIGLGDFDTVRLLIQDEDNVSIEVASGAAIAAVAAGRASPARSLTWEAVFKRVKLLATAVVATSIVSVSIFPGFLTEDVEATELGNWYPVLLVGTYIIFDLLGRLLTAEIMPQKHGAVFGAAWARLLLVGLFLLVLLLGSHYTISVVAIFVLTALLGFSNGYLVATLTVLLPKANPAHDAETAGMLNALVLNIGVLIGAGLSWIWIIIS